MCDIAELDSVLRGVLLIGDKTDTSASLTFISLKRLYNGSTINNRTPSPFLIENYQTFEDKSL